MISALIPFLGPVLKIVDKVLPNTEDKERLRSELLSQAMNAESELYKAQGKIVAAEAQGESWMQRNWRPITMLTFVFIIGNNYIIQPYATAFGFNVPTLHIPDGLWGLLQIGIGGYIASRGTEKVVRNIQQGGVPLVGGKAKDSITREDLDNDRRKLLQEMRNYQ